MDTNQKPNKPNKPIRVQIRPVKLGDLAQVIAVNEASLAENYPRGLWLNKFPECKPYSFVAVVLNQVVGYVFSCGDMVISVAIYEEYRGKGIGRALMENCLNARLATRVQSGSDASGNDILRLHVRTTNERAIALYTNLGFHVDKTVVDYYVNPTCDAFEMVNQLDGKHKYTKRDRFVV